ASRLSGVSAKMVRYYESVGLLEKAARRNNGYRDYSSTDVAKLQFVRRTRDLGFSLEEIGALLALWQDRKRPARAVKTLAQTHIAVLEQRQKEIRSVVRALKRLVAQCHGDDRPDCPILDGLAAPVEVRKHC
nr:MerR family DNA-binding protein [Hyphomonas sp.]